MDMVHTQGKQDKKVATLLNRDMVDSINLLIATRAACGILDTNKYVFANQLDGHLSTWTSLRDQAVQAQCSKPELINCNSLRNSTSQQLQEAAIEIGKVSKLLIAAESGKLSKYKGKSLAALQFDAIDSSNDEPPEKPPYQRPQRKRRVKAARKEICSRDSHADMDSDDSLHDPTYTLEKGSSGEELKIWKDS
ncbi:hypothetical protein MAR_027284 [Mya arenaria]|uniref:Uncharacterized protein n=1 Tax=Mya arenaria TaxID=6604 RepID=A0ABY7EVX5_MYAAR|nr:hypothetical protein MAR_027284 [Mya arenaria]